MVELTVCSAEEEDEEESTTIESSSCTVESLACCHERPAVPEVTERSADHPPNNRRSREPNEVTKVIAEPCQESGRDFATSGAPSAITGRFSLFKWFKRGSRDSGSSWDRRDREKQPSHRKSARESSDLEENEIASELSSNGSVETLYSTATVRSFAFRSGSRVGATEDAGRHFEGPRIGHFEGPRIGHFEAPRIGHFEGPRIGHFEGPRIGHFADSATRSVGPFGVGAAKVNAVKSDANNRDVIDVTKTLPANALSRKRDITARYSLQSCNGSAGGSCANFRTRGNEYTLERSRDPRKTIRVHVRGKRRAPGPPIDAIGTRRNDEETAKTVRTKGRGKRRQAPKPPEGAFAKLRVSDNFASRQAKECAGVEEETGTHIFPAKKETGSAISSSKEEIGGAKFPAKKQTGSATVSSEKETGSAISSSKEETGSANFPGKKETGSAISSSKEETGSAAVPVRKEAGSATVSTEKQTGSANTLTSEVTGSASSSVKKETACASGPIRKEIGSEVSKNVRQNGDACSRREEIVTSGTRDKEESKRTTSPNEASGKAVTATKKVSPCGEIFAKSPPRSRPEEIEESKAPPSGPNSSHFDTQCKSIVEQANSANFTFSRNDEDAPNLIVSIESSPSVEEKSASADLAGSISNDSLVLQGGVLHSRRESQALTSGATAAHASDLKINVSRSKGRISVTTGSQTSATAMPRPWYKRNVFEHTARDSGTSRRGGDVLRSPPQPEVRDDRIAQPTNSPLSAPKCPQIGKNQDGGTLGRLSFFHKHDKAADEKRKENKRKSGLSLLANISELDKEAAAIVQEEQARTRAASVLSQASRSGDEKLRNETEDIVQEIVASAMETSPKRGTRALISKFNAIGNITKVTVNTSFFAKNSQSRADSKADKSELPKNSAMDEHRKSQFSKTDNFTRAEKDLSRYFMPVQRNAGKKKIGTETSEASSRNSSKDLAARLSFFQSIESEEKTRADCGIRECAIGAKIGRFNEPIFVKGEGNLENSPKFSRLRINVFNEETAKPKQESIDESINEFTNIFREIGEKLSDKESKTTNPEAVAKKPETSSQVSRVLDILVEAEKNDRQRPNFPRSKIGSPFVENSEKNYSKSKIAPNGEPEENAMKTDLREMLKEMKHSLPKRPKTRKTCDEDVLAEKIENARKQDVKGEFFSMNDKKKEFFLSDNEKSSLLSTATITHPPMIMIGPPRNDEPVKSVLRPSEEYERQKVSSAAQTSGNLRKITDQDLNKSSKWRNEDVIYRTSGKGVATPGTSGLTKNTFQLIRPREFAQIEAIKTMKNLNVEENTYANVMEQSLYANALVRPRKQNEPEIHPEAEQRSHFSEAKKLRDRGRERNDMEAMDSREPQNMNTLAVNRLLRKLEAAIASGHHQQAAGLAKELARLKIHCSVVRQRTKAKDVVNVNMYIEDKLAHQGPIPLRLTRSMTVAQLKAKVFTEFEIPIHVQRWIVGKDLADDDSTTLEDFQTVEGSPIFLYLVAPELKIDDTTLQDEKEVLDETPKDPETEKINVIPEVVNVDELTEPPVECQTINEEDEECITEEVRMERYEALISLENCDVIPNSEPIECPICFVTYGPQEGVILRDCLHMFCRPCIANTIRYCEEAEVKCPFRDTEYTCESTLQEREIKALVEPEVYQQHLAKSIAQAENNAGNNAFHCKTPDCPGWCIYDDNVNNFLCPVCDVNNCLTCQVVHTGKNCRQYQEELRLSKETDQESKRTAAMLEEMVDRGEALPCPTCAVVLMKKWGCDWLRCSMCKTEICWVTRGPRWGPGGKGDTSGGCRCGEKGIKCHPRCNYCH